jgi:hypothetical protein
MPGSKTTLKELAKQLRDPRHIDILRELLRRRYGLRLRVANLRVKDGYLFYVGTTGQIICYYMRGTYYLRTKGSLDRKAFYKKKCFEGSRRSAERFALGNELASMMYARVMESGRVYPLFCFIKKKAIQLLKEGKTVEEAENILTDYLQSFGLIRRADRQGMMSEERTKEVSTSVSLFNKNFRPVLTLDLSGVSPKMVACEVIQDDS